MKRKILAVFDFVYFLFTCIYFIYYSAFVISWSWWLLCGYKQVVFVRFMHLTEMYLKPLVYFWIISLSCLIIRLLYKKIKLSKKTIKLTLTVNFLWILTWIIWTFYYVFFFDGI